MKKYNVKNMDDPEYASDYVSLERKWFMKLALFLKYLIILPLVRKTPKDLSIIDIGCGHGMFLRFLLERDFNNLFGLDLVNVLYPDVNSSPHVTFIEQSILHEHPTGTRTFAVVNVSGMLHHLPPESLCKVARNLSSMLDPEGYLYIYEPNRFSWIGIAVYDYLLRFFSPLLYRMSQYEYEIQKAFAAEMPSFLETLREDFDIISYTDKLFFYSIIAKKR